MDRREALKRAAWMMGGALSAPTIMAVLKGCKAKPSLNWKPAFFNEEQASLVSQLADVIIPKTDTPGAIDVGVPSFIDQLVKDVYKEEDQKKFTDGLAAFDAEVKAQYGDSFVDLDPAQQIEFANKMYSAAWGQAKDGDKPFIIRMKEVTVTGFCTSEAGATQVLQYEAVPGSYKGCIPLSEAGNGKTWAT